MTELINFSLNALDALDCKTCPTGYYCPSASTVPTPCPRGRFSGLQGIGSLNECWSCTAGMACPQTGLTYPPVKCAAGYYCPAGSVLPNATIHACPAGYYTDYHNLTHARECTLCPERQSCQAGTGGWQKPPQLCAKGQLSSYSHHHNHHDHYNHNCCCTHC